MISHSNTQFALVAVKIEENQYSDMDEVNIKVEPAEEFEADIPKTELRELIIKTENDDHNYYQRISDHDMLDSIGVVDEKNGIITVSANLNELENMSPCSTAIPLQQSKSDEDAKCEKLHTNSDLTCVKCSSNFPTISGLIRHTKAMHGKISSNQKYKCFRCHEKFTTPKRYEAHIRSILCYIAKTSFTCDICPMSFESDIELINHRNHHNSNMFFCRFYCGKFFENVDLCEVHEYAFHKVEKYICNVCHVIFPNRESLFVHSASHSGLQRFVCSYCRKWFKCSDDLELHKRDTKNACGKMTEFVSSSKVNDCTAQLAITGLESTAKRKTISKNNAPEIPIKFKLKLKPEVPKLPEHNDTLYDDRVFIKEEPLSDHESTQNGNDYQIKIKDEPMSDNEEEQDCTNNNVDNQLNDELCIKEETIEFVEEGISEQFIENSVLCNDDHTNTIISSKISSIQDDELVTDKQNETDLQVSPKTTSQNLSDAGKKINRLRKDELDAIENNPQQSKVVDRLKQQFLRAQEIMLNGSDGNSQDCSISTKDENSLSANELSIDFNSMNRNNSIDSVNNLSIDIEAESVDEKCDLADDEQHPPTLYLPVPTEVDPTLCDLKKSFPLYRFVWICPKCPRTYMQKHAFKGHLVSAHDMDKNDLHSLQIEVKPIRMLRSLEDKQSTKVLLKKPVEFIETKTKSRSKKCTHTCTICGRACSSRTALNDHIIANCGRDPPYQCPDCEKRFFSASTLNSHRSIHTGDLPHSCKYCDKRFRTRGQVTVHHRTHTGEKPFPCKVCGQSFTHRETLIAHLSRHIGMKRYKCYGCNHQFSCISGLKTHREVRKETCGQIKLNSRALGPRVRVIKGNVIFEPQPEINPYLRSEDPKDLELLTTTNSLKSNK